MNRHTVSCIGSAVVVLGLVTAASSQPGGPGSELPSLDPTAAETSTASAPGSGADREKIWNSPTMLRARAWVQEYCQRSAKISPAEAKQYMTELSQMTPVQMKLWLLKFDAEEQMIRQQQSAFYASRQAGVNAAMGVQQETQQAYANINRDETEAAQTEERSLDTQQEYAAERQMQNAEDRDSLNEAVESQPLNVGGYPPYGYAPWAGSGDYHVHYHVHR